MNIVSAFLVGRFCLFWLSQQARRLIISGYAQCVTLSSSIITDPKETVGQAWVI